MMARSHGASAMLAPLEVDLPSSRFVPELVAVGHIDVVAGVVEVVVESLAEAHSLHAARGRLQATCSSGLAESGFFHSLFQSSFSARRRRDKFPRKEGFPSHTGFR